MMVRRQGKLAVLGLIGLSGTALACSDTACYPTWKLTAAGTSCENRAMLAPGNDTRTNLLFLLHDRTGQGTAGRAYPEAGWNTAGFGQVFLDPHLQRAAFYPVAKADAEGEEAAYAGTRCAGFAAATEALKAAMAADRALPAAERDSLLAARTATDCARAADAPAPAWPSTTSAAGGEFLTYLRAADAFYVEDWAASRSGFAALSSAADPWLRETAAYMAARTALAEAQGKAIGEYGDFDPAKVDKAIVARGQAALGGYLAAYPQGRYAASARGLVRRGYWLAGDFPALTREYARLLHGVDPASPAAADLVQEIDNKLLFNAAAGPLTSDDALLLATIDLRQMRAEMDWSSGSGEVFKAPSFAPASLAAQAPAFAGEPELYSFLQGNAAFYLLKDYRHVLQLIPDDARRASYSNLAFSRQVLRGLALAALGDRNEAGFWLELMNGANGLWQRPTAELGLAMNWERHGKLAAVFAKDSPIREPMIRRQLLVHSAGPTSLRMAAVDPAPGEAVRDLAAFTLLYKELSRGAYAAFAADLALVRRGANADAGVYAVESQDVVPAGLFVRGNWSDGYPCGPIGETARKLAANPQDVGARLCLGDFWRLNGFDGFTAADTPPRKDELGGFANQFPGRPLVRSAIYAAVLADPRAAPDDKAYALYRAVNCYAPSGYNACGGEAVGKAQRKAWYDRLKRDYPASSWAKKLRYYW